MGAAECLGGCGAERWGQARQILRETWACLIQRGPGFLLAFHWGVLPRLDDKILYSTWRPRTEHLRACTTREPKDGKILETNVGNILEWPPPSHPGIAVASILPFNNI